MKMTSEEKRNYLISIIIDREGISRTKAAVMADNYYLVQSLYQKEYYQTNKIRIKLRDIRRK